MGRTATGLLAWVLVGGTAAASAVARTAALEPGLLLYAAPGLRDPNFTKTVVLLLDHGPQGSLGVVLNRPTTRGVAEVLDLGRGAPGGDFPVFSGGPVQPEAVLALVRSSRSGPRARTVLDDVQLTRDLDEVEAALAERDAPLRVRVFSGYAGWGPGQLAAEVRGGSWVLEPADAATVFSPEPSRLWERVHDILGRLKARRSDAPPAAGPVARLARDGLLDARP